MPDHRDLAALQARSLRLQERVRQQTYSPDNEKALRRFSAWETAEFVLRLSPADLRRALAEDPALPRGDVAPGGQRWFRAEEVEALRRALAPGRGPGRPQGRRAIRAAVANFKGGAGKSTVALHLAHGAALDGWRVLLVDCDPQATLSHAMGITDAQEDATVWGIMARDLARATRALNASPPAAASGRRPALRRVPEAIEALGLETRDPADFIRPTAWPSIDMIPSCANAAFVEFATAQYRHLNPDWAFFAALSRYLDGLTDEAFDLILFDCPPAIGYQSINAVFAADMLLIPTGPGYWEYDSTTSFIGQLAEALEDLAAGAEQGAPLPTGRVTLPKSFAAMRVLLTRMEPGNALHEAMRGAYAQVFGATLCAAEVEHTRAVEQSGRFLCSVYEMDYRDMTRETWKRARRSFDAVWDEVRGVLEEAWEAVPRSDFPAGKSGAAPAGTAEDAAEDVPAGKEGRRDFPAGKSPSVAPGAQAGETATDVPAGKGGGKDQSGGSGSRAEAWAPRSDKISEEFPAGKDGRKDFPAGKSPGADGFGDIRAPGASAAAPGTRPPETREDFPAGKPDAKLFPAGNSVWISAGNTAGASAGNAPGASAGSSPGTPRTEDET